MPSLRQNLIRASLRQKGCTCQQHPRVVILTPNLKLQDEGFECRGSRVWLIPKLRAGLCALP